MRVKTITETCVCDLCEKEMIKPVSVSEGLPTAIISISYDGWYRGVYTAKDICYECNEKVRNFLISNNMLTWREGIKEK